LWVLLTEALSGASLIHPKLIFAAVLLILVAIMLYRDVRIAFYSAPESRTPEDSERVRDVLVKSAQSNESWVCTHCGEPSPMDYGACVHCGRPAGRLR
jgi:hypothetical protein